MWDYVDCVRRWGRQTFARIPPIRSTGVWRSERRGEDAVSAARGAAVSALVAAAFGGAYVVVQSDTQDRPKVTVSDLFKLPVPCERRDAPVVVKLPSSRWPHIADHVNDAVHAGVHKDDRVAKAYPSMLHIDRAGADENRRLSLRGVPTRKGYDRDEYPMALSDEGGSGADVRYVRLKENRAAGASMGTQLRAFCDGQSFRIATK